jgi:murein DD-endopeptidase
MTKMNISIGRIRRSSLLLIAIWYICSVVSGCASAPQRPVTGYTATIGEKAAHIATTMIGKPYRYKGESPSGFDCSGLVRYSYRAAGLNVPHGTEALKNRTRSIGTNMRIGDLLFFNERRKQYSHVGIYLGGSAFVHAPSTGGQVRKESLEDPYWKKTFVDARRFM